MRTSTKSGHSEDACKPVKPGAGSSDHHHPQQSSPDTGIRKGHTQNGKVKRVTGIIQNIGELHQARKDRSFILNCANGILQTSDDLILTLDTNLKVILLNSALTQQFQATFGERLQVGQSIMNALEHHPNEKRIYQRLWGASPDSGQLLCGNASGPTGRGHAGV